MTLGVVKLKGRAFLPRSAQAVAAVIRVGNATPLAWVMWDETGMPWIGLKKESPVELFRMLAPGKTPTTVDEVNADLKSGARIFPLRDSRVAVPARYALAACSPRRI